MKVSYLLPHPLSLPLLFAVIFCSGKENASFCLSPTSSSFALLTEPRPQALSRVRSASLPSRQKFGRGAERKREKRDESFFI